MNTQNSRFDELNIMPEILDMVGKHFSSPTPIQHKVIPHAIEGKDIVGIAQTGTGKTLAFGIPMLQRLLEKKGQGLIMLPTRELAIQVDEMLRKIAGASLRTAVLIGGAPAYKQVHMLNRNPHIVIATPGRLIDHLKQRSYNLNQINIIVLDEADRMFDIGFIPQIKEILSLAPKNRQTLMFSATMPEAIAKIADNHMQNPVRIEVSPAGTTVATIEQGVFVLNRGEKPSMLNKLLAENEGTVLVFVRTKHGAKKITFDLRLKGHAVTEIHSNRSLAQRKDAMYGFKSGKYRIMVATDIAARGIDVKDISLVLNYDLPDNCEDYVHRIGRTGRAGKTGKAFSFATHAEQSNIRYIEKLISQKLPIINSSQRQDLPRQALPTRRNSNQRYRR